MISRYEKLKKEGIRSFAAAVCNKISGEALKNLPLNPDKPICDNCAFNKNCLPLRNGVLAWLEEEVED